MLVETWRQKGCDFIEIHKNKIMREVQKNSSLEIVAWYFTTNTDRLFVQVKVGVDADNPRQDGLAWIEIGKKGSNRKETDKDYYPEPIIEIDIYDFDHFKIMSVEKDLDKRVKQLEEIAHDVRDDLVEMFKKIHTGFRRDEVLRYLAKYENMDNVILDDKIEE